MELFKKRETVTQNIAYLGIMSAVNVVAVIMMTYVLPLLFIPFVFALPLCSTVVTLFCKKRYFPIYAVATLGICMLVTLSDFTVTLFYVFPSLLTGFIFGLFLSKKLPAHLSILSASIINMGLTYLSLPLIKLIYRIDMIDSIAKIFGLETFAYLDFVTPCFILILSIIQEALTYAFIENELPKLGINGEEVNLAFLDAPISLTSSLLSLICFLIKPTFFSTFAMFFMLIPLYFAVYEIWLIGNEKNFKMLIVDGIITLLSLLVFAILFQYIVKPFQLITLNICFDLLILANLVNLTLTKKRKSVE